MSEIAEIKNLIEEQGRAWEAFRAANDERLKQVEAKGAADAVLVTQVEATNKLLGELQVKIQDLETKAARPRMGQNGREIDPEVEAHAKAFNTFMRSGEEKGLLDAQNAMSIGSDPDGGYAVPEELDREILSLEQNLTPMRELANVITVGSSNYRKLVSKHGANSGWVGETEGRPATNAAQLAELTPYWGEIYANPQATQTTLEDVFFNVESWLAGEVSMEFAIQEGAAFVSGNGTNKPKGFLAYTIASTADSARAFGSIQYVPTGVAAAISDGTHPAFDALITAIQSMKAGLRSNASWLMNSLTAGAYRKVKDDNGQYIWQPSVQAGQPAMLLGYPTREAEDMPDVAADAYPAAFANWKRAYTIVDRVGIRVLRDPFTNKPYVGFYTTKRVGGFVADSEAIKLVKVAAS